MLFFDSRRALSFLAILTVSALPAGAAKFNFDQAEDAFGYHETFGIDPDAKPAFKVTLLSAGAPGNVFWPGEPTTFTFQIENLADQPLAVDGRIELIPYSGGGREGEPWVPEFKRLAEPAVLPWRVDLAAKGWSDHTVTPRTPERFGAYALVVDLGAAGRVLLTNYVRTVRSEPGAVQYPHQSLEDMPPPILERLGVHAIRYGVSYYVPDSRRRQEQKNYLAEQFAEMHAHQVTATVEIGTGGEGQPLGRGRPHVDAEGKMLGGKEDLVWLPEFDDDYQQFVYELACTYGWPKGPVTSFMLWNEPWEGLSISGWGADMIRYRELYKRMGDAIFKARKDAGVEVLIGGCDSSSNTWDKLFPDGSTEFLPYLDFCSIHYQGLSSPVLYPLWNQRRHYQGRVRIWDTESWVANTDDRFAGVVATNRAAGYDRAMGIRGSNVVSVLSHHRVAKDTIHTANGDQTIVRPLRAWPAAAAVAACQKLIGERPFKQILRPEGLPWIYVFDGLNGNPDDGTVVVLGDIAALFDKGATLHRSVRSLDEVNAKIALRKQTWALPVDSAERLAIEARLAEPRPMANATMRLPADPRYTLRDAYGNVVSGAVGRIAIPLDGRGFFLRPSGQPGSFAALLQALDRATVEGLQPVELTIADPVLGIRRAAIKVTIHNVLNRRLDGKLFIGVSGQEPAPPPRLVLGPYETRVLSMPLGSEMRADNSWQVHVLYDAGPAGKAFLDETVHLNAISHRSPTVDGDLRDWSGALQQVFAASGVGTPSFTEQMWLPFAAASGDEGGLATVWFAADDDAFYLAAKVADPTAHPGTVRYATRNDDRYFYPDLCLGPPGNRRDADELVEHRWPEGVRHFSYRTWPDLPSGYSNRSFDNLLLAFNAIPDEQDEWDLNLPGRPRRFIAYKDTDYEYALNPVAEEYGGGTEVWRLQAPGMPRKHFYPRQPKHPLEGAVADAKLVVRYQDGTRFFEASLPWSELPHVKALRDAGRPVKVTVRVNDDRRGPTLELARGRSVSRPNPHTFHPDWAEHWANEVAFGWE